MKITKITVDVLIIISLISAIGSFFSAMLQSLFYADYNPRETLLMIGVFLCVAAFLALIRRFFPEEKIKPHNPYGWDPNECDECKECDDDLCCVCDCFDEEDYHE